MNNTRDDWCPSSPGTGWKGTMNAWEHMVLWHLGVEPGISAAWRKIVRDLDDDAWQSRGPGWLSVQMHRPRDRRNALCPAASIFALLDRDAILQSIVAGQPLSDADLDAEIAPWVLEGSPGE